MKKTLAFLICLAMLFTALSVNVFAAETAPTIEIVTNSISEGKTTFAVKINGNPVEGVDIKVDVTGDAEITGVSAKNFYVTGTLASDEDYKISKDKKSLHAVGLQKDTNTGEIISVTATATTDFDISVACDIATSDTTKVTESGTAKVTADAPKNETVTGETVSQPVGTGYFIPYGSVYKVKEDGKYEYANKGTEGTFNGTTDMTATQFKVPDNGLGTFGISESMKKSVNPSKQFGNYAEKFQSAQYGTMIIVGDWVGYKDWYLKNKGYSDAVLFEKVYTAYRTAMNTAASEGETPDYVKLTVAGGNEIHVYDVPQTKVMWQSETVLEYAVRVINNFNQEKSYSAAAYCIKADKTLVLSQDILTTKIGVTQQ